MVKGTGILGRRNCTGKAKRCSRAAMRGSHPGTPVGPHLILPDGTWHLVRALSVDKQVGKLHCSALLLPPTVCIQVSHLIKAQLKYHLPFEVFQDYPRLALSSLFSLCSI